MPKGKKRYKIEKQRGTGVRPENVGIGGFIAQDVEQLGQDLNIDIAAFKRSTIKCEDGTEEDFCEFDYLQVIPFFTKAFTKSFSRNRITKTVRSNI